MTFVVFAGQSNTGGAGMSAATLTQPWTPDPQVLIWDAASQAFVQMQPGLNTGYGDQPSAWGPEVAFARAFRAAHPDEALRIVKVAHGGTGLDQDPGAWVYDWSPQSVNELFDEATDIIDAASAAAGGRPDALFFGQGEEDATRADKAADYEANLEDFFAQARADWLHDADGRIGFFRIGPGSRYADEVRGAQTRVDARDPRADSTDAASVPTQADGLHFTAAGYDQVGAAYAQLYETWGTSTPPPAGGVVLTSDQYADTLAGGAGADTLLAGRGPDLLTGGAGADLFVWRDLPWNAGTVTDFVHGIDRLDLSALLDASGFDGDPVSGRYVSFESDGAGGTRVMFDTDGPGSGQSWSYLITTVRGLAPSSFSTADLAGGAPQQPPPPPPAGGGVKLVSDQYADQLVGGAGTDTLVAGQGPDQLTGGAGADLFVFGDTPWNAGAVHDFQPGLDRLDLSAIFDRAPAATLTVDGSSAGSRVLVDIDGPGGEWPFLITTLQGVSPGQLAVSDWVI